MDGEESNLVIRSTLNLVKGGQEYVFTYSPGQEKKLLAMLFRWASDPELNLELVDVLRVLDQMTSLAREHAFLCPTPQPRGQADDEGLATK